MLRLPKKKLTNPNPIIKLKHGPTDLSLRKKKLYCSIYHRVSLGFPELPQKMIGIISTQLAHLYNEKIHIKCQGKHVYFFFLAEIKCCLSMDTFLRPLKRKVKVYLPRNSGDKTCIEQADTRQGALVDLGVGL